MFGKIMRIGGIQIMDNLKNGPVKISQLKSAVQLYGSAFDFVLSDLMMSGLVRKFEKDGEDYVELTELGKNAIMYGQYYGYHGLHHGYRKSHQGCW
ncbi:hypothetical protein DFR86_04620 [Acidianus sulfidivorans JP7]|uniref:ArnR1-like winged helix-turn-helix domain-containing protein n=1 Tax=Acidianus sulfidivorans JP7 TaxID=619593 RepID=A0A2U9ILL8_9CREN|nr:hypothetical protein [Acidianus sulfidivorans]AWR96911.1 hypothetical protein DFR86_04620 [Acidianus sulfidivorans JP7]